MRRTAARCSPVLRIPDPGRRTGGAVRDRVGRERIVYEDRPEPDRRTYRRKTRKKFLSVIAWTEEAEGKTCPFLSFVACPSMCLQSYRRLTPQRLLRKHSARRKWKPYIGPSTDFHTTDRFFVQKVETDTVPSKKNPAPSGVVRVCGGSTINPPYICP